MNMPALSEAAVPQNLLSSSLNVDATMVCNRFKLKKIKTMNTITTNQGLEQTLILI